MKILLVEDDVQYSELLCGLFVAEGYQVTPVFDGHQAKDMIQKEKFDLIVSDVSLGSGPDGFQVHKEAKRSQADTDFILYTSSVYPGMASLAKDLGIMNFIQDSRRSVTEIKKAVMERMQKAVDRNTEAANKLLGL